MQEHHSGSHRTELRVSSSDRTKDLPNTYNRSTAETTINPIGQNIPVIYLHLEDKTNTLLLDDVLVCLRFCWCPCMAINVSVQYDGGFLPDIVLLTQCYYHRGTRLNAMKRFCIFSY